MSRIRRLLLVGFTPILLALAGCGGHRQWEIVVANNGDVPCSFFVSMGTDANSNAKVEDVAAGKKLTLIVGDATSVVQIVKVVRGKDEQNLIPNAELPVGKRYTITVTADGKVETAFSDR